MQRVWLLSVRHIQVTSGDMWGNVTCDHHRPGGAECGPGFGGGGGASDPWPSNGGGGCVGGCCGGGGGGMEAAW